MPESLRIGYIDGFRLHRALHAGVLRVVSRQEHLNRINVFPVADGDTGTNIALTLQAVLAGITNNLDRHVGNLLNALADAALDGARGNSGAILAQFFQGMSDGATALRLLSVKRFTRAVRLGSDYAREALSDPKEGTIITVLREFADALDAHVEQGDGNDLTELLRAGLEASERSLAGTTQQLEQLRRAGVVDAGAAGFVELLRGIVEFIDSGSLRDMQGYRPSEDLAADAERGVGEVHGAELDLTHRYCTECVITGTDIDRRTLREQLAEIGSSLVIAGTKQKVKVHVHVDSPAQAFLIAEGFGTLSSQKADDMQAQSMTAAAHARGVAVITDSGADLPDAELERLNIHMVPLRLHFGDRGFLDKVSISPREFYEELSGSGVHPKTSQPAPGDFRRQFQFLSTHHDAVLSINLTSKASGTHQAAESAAARVEGGHTRVFDSRTVSAGQALVAMHAAELAHAGLDIDAIIAELEATRDRTHVWGAIADLRYAVRGGRVSRGKKLLTDVLRLRPILTAKPDGTISVGGVLVGKQRMVEKFARFVGRRLDPARSWRLVIGHANAPEEGARLRELLVARVPTVQVSWLVELGPALGVHAGPGALVVGAQDVSAD
ncbi:MAG: DegV family EDD domain-containing protein [Xanthomonadaceae bacterium]|nr:DegV family EDD domain-containing protein [Xanthomonadaceae bacterium]